MNAPSQQRTFPAQALQFCRNETGDYVLHSSHYTDWQGKLHPRAFPGAAGGDVGLKATLMCLLNLKLLLETKIQGASTTDYRVLGGEEASYLITTLRQMRKTGATKWHQMLYGVAIEPFLCPLQRGYPPTIRIPQGNRHYPREIKVYLAQGVEPRMQLTELKTLKEVELVIASLQEQAQGIRRRKRGGGVLGDSGPEDATNTGRRSSRAWGALAQWLRDTSDPKTSLCRVFALNRRNDGVWGCPQTFVYLALQFREYMKANFSSAEQRWTIAPSKPVHAAVHHALANARRFLPLPQNNGHCRTAFEDWDPRQQNGAGRPRFEIARILIWPTGRLQTDEGQAVLRLHQMFNVPLFYLEPTFVADGPPDEYILFCKNKHDETTAMRELRGLAWEPGGTDGLDLVALDYHPLAHFLSLLKHPKLLFVVDAQEMLRRGLWSAFDQEPMVRTPSRNGELAAS